MSVPPVAAADIIALPGYEILIAGGLVDAVGSIVHRVAPAHRYAIITDERVAPLYGSRVRRSVGESASILVTMPAGEAHKTRETWARLTDALLAASLGRDTTIIALGGGVVGDLAGFVAATYMRGVPYVQVPTTLLAMIDSSIGGKTGVDTAAGKNLVGAFHQPAAVIVDPEVLATLPARERRAGAAEAIKHGAIADARYFDELARALPAVLDAPASAAMRRLLAHGIRIKAEVVRQDEREGGLRKTLNFGHTLGHAIEAATGYRLLHGEAVALGMVLEARLAERLGIAAGGTATRLREVIDRAGLPTILPPGLAPDDVLAATRSDKKARAGRVAYALPTRIGAMHQGTGWGVAVADGDVLATLSAAP